MPRKSSVLLRASLALVGLAVFNNVMAARSERRHPARGRFIEVDGVRLHYLDRGEGPAVVLIHGNGAMAEDWEASSVFGRLAENHRVIAFDRPGFGYSRRPGGRVWTAGRQATLIADAMRLLGVGPATVAGHSWGAVVALELALRRPEQVSRLVLLSGFYYPEARKDVALMSGTAAPLLGDVVAHTILPPVGWLLRNPMFRAMFAPAPVATRFLARFPYGLSLRPRQARATARDTGLMMAAVTALHGRIPGPAMPGPAMPSPAMPVAIMAGTGDLIVNFDRHSARLHAALPDSTLHRLEGGGHMIQYSFPGEVARLVAGAG